MSLFIVIFRFDQPGKLELKQRRSRMISDNALDSRWLTGAMIVYQQDWLGLSLSW